MTTVDQRRRSSRRWLVLVLAASAAAAFGLNLGMGAVSVAPSEVVSVLSRRIGLSFGNQPAASAEAVVWTLRVPRALLAIVVGGGLAAVGAALQGVFRNPLADPQLLGIGPGAAIGAVAGAAAGGVAGSIAGGTVAGLLVALLLRRLSRRTAGDPARFVLVGVALGAALTAWVGFLVFASDRSVVPPMEFWLLGSLSGATWRVFGTALVLVAVPLTVLLINARSLDLLSLGEDQARHLGVDVDLTITVVLMAVGAATGATVGAVGVVGFVGLVIPHVVRRMAGPSHRFLMAASFLGGAAFVLAADLVARTVLTPVEVAVGLLTAVIGGPFFLILLGRARLA
ncbi:MAG: iron ABC transporter permease [Acidimicrobiia bacterium]|nr:iron ABC transporter permease [Acidimicrobiia bacterium]